jgi:hypothetical protein
MPHVDPLFPQAPLSPEEWQGVATVYTFAIVSHPTRSARARRVLGCFVEIIRPCRPLDA